jgi:hypothetical protein
VECDNEDEANIRIKEISDVCEKYGAEVAIRNWTGLP